VLAGIETSAAFGTAARSRGHGASAVADCGSRVREVIHPVPPGQTLVVANRRCIIDEEHGTDRSTAGLSAERIAIVVEFEATFVHLRIDALNDDEQWLER
jgi:hypothetical protein